MKPIRVVLVDDSKVFLDALYSCLARWDGVEITGCAATGADGLSLIESDKPDLVLMDIFMPSMNGVEASKCIQRKGGLPKVVLMTSFDAPGVRQFALGARADAFIFKQDLYSELGRCMEGWFPPMAEDTV
jgi:DNA-binding NarL/FixJ family response regulator